MTEQGNGEEKSDKLEATNAVIEIETRRFYLHGKLANGTWASWFEIPKSTCGDCAVESDPCVQVIGVGVCRCQCHSDTLRELADVMPQDDVANKFATTTDGAYRDIEPKPEQLSLNGGDDVR
jgi:hypothetical protein